MTIETKVPNWRALYEETLAQLLICKSGPHAATGGAALHAHIAESEAALATRHPASALTGDQINEIWWGVERKWAMGLRDEWSARHVMFARAILAASPPATPANPPSGVSTLPEAPEPSQHGAEPEWNSMCGCQACNREFIGTVMFLCAACGNKRCPHATNHAMTCTGSNEPGQPGSSYA